MCGIAGLVTKDELRPGVVERMCQVMAHRGPDDSGIELWPEHGVGLGHNRLAIIDLSSDGHNPMANEDGSVWIVFNGEIYNFQSLRAELETRGHLFRSETDTEVILHAYEEWGDDHVHHLRGMFAYAIYDRRKNGAFSGEFRVLLVRDRIGIKPLFYAWQRQTLIFASEIKGILATPHLTPEIDNSALYDYLTYLYIPAPKTAYKDIYKLKPGHMLILENGHHRIRQYWRLSADSHRELTSVDDAVEMLRQTLSEAIKLHMISDVPLGVFLSGGIDSSSVASIMARVSDSPIHTFSIGFDVAEHSETQYARIVAQRCQTLHREQQVGISSLQEMLPKIVRMYDEPFADGSAIPTYSVSAATRKFATVALSGDGGDEVFWGYQWYQRWLDRQPGASRVLPRPLQWSVERLLNVAPLPRRAQNTLQYLAMDDVERYGRMVCLFTQVEKRRILTPHWRRSFRDYDSYWHFRDYWRRDLDPMTQAQFLDMHTYLPNDILTKVDRASMAVSLEVRPALLDHLVVERVFGLPYQVRIPGKKQKALLKLAVADLLPPEILNRPKKGFSSPMSQWFNAERAWAEEFISQGTAVEQGILHPDAVQVTRTPYGGARLWGLLVLEQWLRNHMGLA